MAWKIPTIGDAVGALIGSIPKIIKYVKDRGRINEVNKIDNAVDTADDKSINGELRRAVKKYENETKADQ